MAYTKNPKDLIQTQNHSFLVENIFPPLPRFELGSPEPEADGKAMFLPLANTDCAFCRPFSKHTA